MTDAAKKIDAYITKAPEFAQPVLERFRKAAHRASPDIEETIKWGLPCFEYQGLVAGMGAYKQHVALNFWRGMLIPDPDKLFAQVGNNEMAAIKVASVKAMPPQAVLVRYLKAAIKLNVAQAKTRQAAKKTGGPKTTTKRSAKKKTTKRVTVPADFATALARKKKAQTTFDGFSYTYRKEYVEWITAAKRAETRKRHIKQAVEWLAEGKPRNWKYMNC
jgi:uncharacterized protein YdeI (YjbR/CyaY-like superfamily)